MEELLKKIPDIIEIASLVLTTVTLLATVIVRLTPTKADDKFMGKISGTFLKIMQWLPTIGINPKTKQLEQTIAELREKTDPGISIEKK